MDTKSDHTCWNCISYILQFKILFIIYCDKFIILEVYKERRINVKSVKSKHRNLILHIWIFCINIVLYPYRLAL